MTHLQWGDCWIALRHEIKVRTSWGKNQLLDLMDDIEYKALRKAEENGTDTTTLNTNPSGSR